MGKKAFSGIYEFSKKQIPLIAFMCILGVLMSACAVRFAVASKNVVDAAANGTDFMKPAFVLLFLLMAQLFLSICHSYINTVANGKILMNIRTSVFSSVLRKDYLGISKYHSGELVNRINGDASIIASGICEIVPAALSIITRIVLGIVTLYSFDKAFALLCIVAGPIIMLTATLYRKKLKSLYKESRQLEGNVRSYMQECIRNIPIIKTFCAQDGISARGDGMQRELYRVSLKKNLISITATICFFLTMTSGYYIALGWCAYKLSKGLMSFGTLIAITDLTGQTTGPFKGLSALIPQYYSVMTSMERLTEFDDIKTESGVKKKISRLDSINIDNICFSYDEATPVLKNYSLQVKNGEMLAICGESGIGKSTLLYILTGIIRPDSGRVYAQTEHGETELDETTRSAFAYVPQNSMLISGTIADNICFSQEFNSDRMWRCADAANIGNFIRGLPNGAETIVGEEGDGLSGGQIQRIAIARALYIGVSVLLLDEATSALDEESERVLLGNIKKIGMTCVLVTHRNTAVSMCDRICYI